MNDFFPMNASALWGLGAFSFVTFFGTLLLLPVLVARIPADYFVRDRTKQPKQPKKSFLRILVTRVLRNVLGLVFIVAGIIMLFTPGQGLLAVLVGITLTDFPGKVKLGLRVVQQRGVLKAVNWIRQKSKVPPLQMP